MRIASRTAFLKGLLKGSALVALAISASGIGASGASAADAVSGPASIQVISTASADVTSSPSNVAAVSSAPSAGILVPAAKTTRGEGVLKNVGNMEEKAIESAQSAIKALEAADSATFEEMNAARQASVRIEAMIELERRVAELNKIRGERGSGRSSYPLAGAIPASALTALPIVSESDDVVEVIKPARRSSTKAAVVRSAPEPVSEQYEVSRIYGVEGKYVAVLSSSGGSPRSVRVGDQLPGGATVKSITSSSVHIDGRGGAYTARVRNIDVVYGSSR